MQFPRADAQQQADNCLLVARGDSVSPHWLVYEVHRDFLSVPRTFAVVAVYSEYEFDWLDAGSLSEAGGESGYGLECIVDTQNSGLPDDVEHWRIVLPRLNFDAWGSLSLKTTIYGVASASEALVRVLSADCVEATLQSNSAE